MQQTVNRKYGDIFTTKRHYTILMGGRGAGRSTVASQLVLAKLISPEYFRCAIMRYILSDIRNSCFQEILDRAEEQGIRDKLEVNESLMTIGYKKNFIHAHAFRKSSGEQKAKLKSLANYNQIWIEEADEPPENDFIQLDDSLRTVKGYINVLMTLNPPPKSHWIIRRWFTLLPSEQPNFFIPTCSDENVLFIHTNWHDNAVNIAKDTQLRYEDYKHTKPAHYWSMIKGYVPETVIGRVFDGWQEIELIPFEAKKVRTGLDFGWDPDPSAIIDVYYYNGGYIFDEVLYATRQRNADLGNTLMTMPDKKLVVADHAEPKSIAELRLMGVNIIACEKGADSIAYGVGVIQSEKISFTSRSIHLKDEYENYAIKKDKDGNLIPGEYTESNNHCLDAARYAMSSIVPVIQRRQMLDNIPHYPHKERVNPAF